MISDLKDLYQNLCEIMIEAKVAFWDTDLYGPGVAISMRKPRPRYVVVIGGNRTWKQRVFVLVHEIGHIFYVKSCEDLNGLALRKRPAKEEAANRTACKILDSVDVGLKKEFAQMYNKLNRNTRRKRFKP